MIWWLLGGVVGGAVLTYFLLYLYVCFNWPRQ